MDRDSVQLDSFRIVPNSFKVEVSDSIQFEIDDVSGLFIWKKRPFHPVLATYRVFPFKAIGISQRMRFDSVMFKLVAKPWTPVLPTSDSRESDFGNLNYSGSFGRSLSFGNRQDVVVNSGLNVRLNGYIGDSILLAAALTDNNIPIQPDGNTQNLNEFDQVFIQFSKKNKQFNIGDIDIRPQSNRYLNFYKRLQGAVYTSKTSKGERHNAFQASAAVAKGKFTRQIVHSLEGNQGPYRLKGANNELFFIVLAGSERVWIDGQLMQRGEDQDYVINYNTAEITFTPKQMINKDKRIQVEFEYADRNYLNAQLYVNNELDLNTHWKFKLSAYSNNDAKNAPINQTLDPGQRQLLADIGDQTQNAFSSAAVLDSFSTGNILYKKIDTVLNGKKDSIYVYSSDRFVQLYQLNFIEVGPGNGNYIQDFSTAVNGKLFRWSPYDDTGKKTGNFEPAILLIAPKTQQMITAGAQFQKKNFMMATDLAISHFDVNTFSKNDKRNDVGMAFNVHGKFVKPLMSKDKSVTTEWQIERITRQFKPLERLRSVEFYREWGLPIDAGPDGELFASTGVEYKVGQKHSLKYNIVSYSRDSGFKAFKHELVQEASINGWVLRNSVLYASNQTTVLKGFFFRPIIDLSKQLKKLLPNYQLGVQYTVEQNKAKFSSTDSLDKRSFSFDVLKLYLKSPEADNRWGLSVFTRGDQLPFLSGLTPIDRSLNIHGYVEWLSNEHHQLRLNATYRKINVYQKSISLANEEGSLLGRSEYMFQVWKGSVTGNVLYELGSGQEPRKEFSFLEVPAGQGEYTWIDYNADGLQQLNEFEQAIFKDQARYIRIFTPTTAFIRSSYLQFNYSIVVNPSNVLGHTNLSGIKRLLSKMYWQSSLQSGRKNIHDGLATFNPFGHSLQDTGLITMDQLFSNTFSLNRLDPKWGIDINNVRSSGKAFLSYGYEARNIDDLKLKGRYTIFKKITLEGQVRAASNRLETPGFLNRNFDIRTVSVEPGITYTHETIFRVKGTFKYDQRKNSGGERSAAQSLFSEIKYNVFSKTSLTGMFTYARIRYDGNLHSALSYNMLEGLLPGRNFLWTMDFTRRLTRFLELSFQYEGRRSGSSGTVHIGRAQVRALF